MAEHLTNTEKIEFVYVTGENLVYKLFQGSKKEFYVATYNSEMSAVLIARNVEFICASNNNFWYIDYHNLHCSDLYNIDATRENVIQKAVDRVAFTDDFIYTNIGDTTISAAGHVKSKFYKIDIKSRDISYIADGYDNMNVCSMAATKDKIIYICGHYISDEPYKLCILDTKTQKTIVADESVSQEDGTFDLVIKNDTVYYSCCKKKSTVVTNSIKDGIMRALNPLSPFMEVAKMIGSLKSVESRKEYFSSIYNDFMVFRKVNVDGTDKRELDIQELENIFGKAIKNNNY